MKQFKTIEEIIEYCRKHNKYCKDNNKEILEMTARIYLSNAGYTNLDGVVTPIYLELKKLSGDNTIGAENKDYLKVSNEDIKETVFLYGSDKLKRFLSKNGYNIASSPLKSRTLKITNRVLASTVISPEKPRIVIPRNNSIDSITRNAITPIVPQRQNRRRSNAVLLKKAPSFLLFDLPTPKNNRMSI